MPLREPTNDELSGERLYGDDFSEEEATKWFEDERNAYADLGASNRAAYVYGYHALNIRHAFRYLPRREFTHALGVGSAHGDEFLPIENRIARVTIVEPSPDLRRAKLSVPVAYKDPNPRGILPLPSGSVDLVLCIAVLHHIPNVSVVIGEIARVLETGGLAIIREPTVSMGDWRNQRRGLTEHERGIPLRIVREMIADVALEVVKETRCMFSLTSRLSRVARTVPYNSPGIVLLDDFVCRLFSWNQTYHPTRIYQRFRPTEVSFVVAKP